MTFEQNGIRVICEHQRQIGETRIANTSRNSKQSKLVIYIYTREREREQTKLHGNSQFA